MKKLDWWTMYFETQRLKNLGLKISQIARALSLSRNTVYRYLKINPDDLDQEGERRKKLDVYTNEIVSWLKKYPDLSAAQVEDWLEEKNGKKIEACESTVRNFVREIRKKHNIPKVMFQRDYQATEDLPMGQQVQVDFGEFKLLDTNGNTIKLWFIGFVLAHSRYKYVEWLDRPFTTQDVVRTHENAFCYFGGKPKEMVYDQDHLILVHENYGDLIFTQEFAIYIKRRNFQVHMCRKADPESKGMIENVVGFVKKNFARHRIFYSLDKLNEECIAWLERRGNGKVHQTTKKIPAQVFLVEKKHLLPITEKLTLNPTSSITSSVRKDNTVVYKGNRYTVPIGTYQGPQTLVSLHFPDPETLQIIIMETGEIVAPHVLSLEKGKLIRNTNHLRDRSQRINQLMEEVVGLLKNIDATLFLAGIHEAKPRYIRDQLELIRNKITEQRQETIDLAIVFCLKNRLYSAVDFCDALTHFSAPSRGSQSVSSTPNEVQQLNQEAQSKRKTKPQVRDIQDYVSVCEGDNRFGSYGST